MGFFQMAIWDLSYIKIMIYEFWGFRNTWGLDDLSWEKSTFRMFESAIHMGFNGMKPYVSMGIRVQDYPHGVFNETEDHPHRNWWMEGSLEVKLPTYGQMQPTVLRVREEKESEKREAEAEERRSTCAKRWLRQVKKLKTHHARSTFGPWGVQKCTRLWREAHFEVKMV